MFESLYTETCALFQPFFLLPIEPAATGIANANAEGGRKNQMAVTASAEKILQLSHPALEERYNYII